MTATHRPPERIDLDDLVLRRWAYDDVDALFAAVRPSWEHLRRWMAWAQDEPTRDSQLGFVRASRQNWQEATDFAYGVFDAAGEVVGSIGLHTRPGPGALEIGYWVRADCEGRGIVTRAAAALTGVALAVPGIHAVEIHCDEANLRSAAVPRRLGYTLVEVREGVADAPAGSGRDLIWRVTQQEWLTRTDPGAG